MLLRCVILIALLGCAAACSSAPEPNASSSAGASAANGGIGAGASGAGASGASGGAAGASSTSAGGAASSGTAGTSGGDGGSAGAAGSSGSSAGASGSVAGAGGGAGASASPAPLDFGALDACPGSLFELFSQDAIDPPLGGSGEFHAVETARWDALEAAMRALASGDLAAAQSAAATASYALCRVDDEGSSVAVARPLVTGEGHAVIALRAAPEHALIVEAPHAWHDADTDIETTEMFIALKARALILSGTYRCASLAASPCSGYTTACTGIPIPYTQSDAAHNVELLFHAAHVAFSETFASDDVVSMHGFNDVGVSVSNTTHTSPAEGSLQVRLVAALAAAFPSEKVTSCQQYTDAPYERRMCGDDNVQARHMNGSPNACTTGVEATSDRFVHVEQSRAVRGERATVIDAFRAALD